MCAHEGFQNLNSWIQNGLFPQVDPNLATEPDPMCAACAFGKARRLSHKTHTGQIAQGHTNPGDGVSSDGLESGTPGRPFTTKGSPSKTRYNYVSFWVDHASSFVYVTFHPSKAATELVRSKAEFEQFAGRFNVTIRNIRADNGVYSAQLFKDACLRQQQNLTFCAVGAHWQNGIAERFIGTITQRARTILLHAMAKWPSVHSKWRSRSWLGVYVGVSNCHSGAVPLIYNPESTHVSPQFHVVYNEYFLTVANSSTLDCKAYLDKL
jgi:hypothetical protein